MSSYHCQPACGPLDAIVSLPGSKSITNRALIAAALADGDSILANVLLAEDTRLMIGALQALGIAITVDEAAGVAEVTGCRGHIPASQADLFCGNAGTVMRFVAAMVSLGHGRFSLDGVPRMRQRPMGDLVAGLRSLGAGVEFVGEEGYPPLVVHACGLRGGIVAMSTPPSSQMISALLLAAPYASGDVFIEVAEPSGSRGYVRMTTAIMERFGVVALGQYGEAELRFVIESSQRYQATALTIEPDASNATYFLAAPAIAGGRVTVSQLGTDSIQGDVGFVDILERMGCGVERRADALTVHGPTGGRRPVGVDVDLSEMPDTVQTLAVLALFSDGPTVIRNVGNLRVKETDRLAALTRELTKLGGIVDEWSDGLKIQPPRRISPAAIDTYDDHRMAMSFALAGLACPGLVIRNPECCAKSFPDFFERFSRLTGQIR